MSGVHMALRTLWIRIDLPLKRSSAAALSERIATRSSTALRAIDCGTCFDAAAEPVFPFDTRGTSSPDLSSSSRMETRSTFMIWNVKSTTLSSSRSSSCCFDSSLEISSSSDSFFSRRSSSVGAVTLRCDVPEGRSTTIAGTPPECFTGSWRTIVPPPGLPPNSNGSDATTCGRGAGAVTAFTRNATLPNVMTSFSAARASVTRAPFKNVPLEDPTSFTSTPPSVRRSSACLREMVGSSIGTSLVTARPTTTVRPGWRSIACSPVVLSSLNTGEKYTSARGLRERQGLQDGLRFGFRFGELARRIRVGDDAGARLHDDAVLEDEGGANRDRGVQVRRAPADVAHGAGVGAAPLGLELVDDLHGAHLGRPGHGARGETGLEHVQRVVAVAQPPPHLAHEMLHV